jgi:putative transcriptional regulator
MFRLALLAGLSSTALLCGADLARGTFLVADRDLGDPNFAGTVVLLVSYDEQEGSLGIIINRRTDVPLSRVFGNIKPGRDSTEAVYLGGPVEPGRGFALLKSGDKGGDAIRIVNGVHLISGKAALEKAVGEALPGTFHIFLGYAGWSGGQLEHEVELSGWHVLPADAAIVFDTNPDGVWEKLIRRTELRIAHSVRKVAIGSTLVARRAGR